MTQTHQQATVPETRKILAAAFSTPDGGSRAAAAIGGAHPDKIGNAAVLYVKPDGTPKFVELRDWGTGRGALVGGLIGIIGGPVGVLAGSGIGVLASRLRDVGFKNEQLTQLGASLGRNSSAVVLELSEQAIPEAESIVRDMGAREVVIEPLDSSVGALFEGYQAPVPEPEPAAVPPTTTSGSSTYL